MIVAVWAVFVALFELARVLAEALFALFAGEDHLKRLLEGMVGRVLMALGTFEPFAAAGGANSDLGVQDVLAHSYLMRHL